MIKNPIFRPSILAALAAAGVTGLLLTGCNSGTPDTVKIGVAQPLTGEIAALGQDLNNGVKLAVDELNKAGFKLNGKPVTLEIVAMDDRSDPATGKEIAQKLVDAGVVAVIGHLNSGVSIEAAPIYAAHHIPQLIISTNPKITQLGLPTTFRLVANDTLQAKAMGTFAAKNLTATRYAVLDDGTPYGKGLSDGAAQQLKTFKKEIPVRQSFDSKTVQFGGLAAKLKEAGVEVVVTTLNDFQMVALLEALKNISYTDISILGGDTVKTTLMLKAAETAKGFYVTSPILNAGEFTNGSQFLVKYQEAYGKEPAYGGHYTYDAMYVLSGAMQRANSADPKKIVETLRHLDGYAPVTGSMKWDDAGEQRYGGVGVYQARKGAWDLKLRSDQW